MYLLVKYPSKKVNNVEIGVDTPKTRYLEEENICTCRLPIIQAHYCRTVTWTLRGGYKRTSAQVSEANEGLWAVLQRWGWLSEENGVAKLISNQ